MAARAAGVAGTLAGMDIREWVDRHGGIVHRRRILDAGVSERRLRAAIASGALQRVRRYWVATPAAPPVLLAAARATGRVACVSAARERGWWIPPDADPRLHLSVRRHAERPPGEIVVHWSEPLVPTASDVLVESIEDSLEHIAGCLAPEAALVLWESAARTEQYSPDALLRVRWRTPAARAVAAAVTGRSDSGLETLFFVRLSGWGLPIRQQVALAGHRVDVLVGDRLVVQLDGFAYHSSPADRARDLAHDRELIARGYTVLRFSYAEVVYGWERVERVLARAVAQGLHLAA
jgi:very-short-patch-repair endonuclease